MHMTVRPHWRRTCASILGACLAAGAADRPNILVIVADDLGYAAISHNPQHPPFVATPRIDALAAGGVAFTQAYTNGNVCSPTRAAILTGRYPQRAGIYTAGEGGRGMSLDHRIIPSYLKPAGYVSGAFGKWHLGVTLDKSPLKRGFDDFFGFLGRGAHSYFALDDPDSPIYRGLEPTRPAGYLTDVLAAEASAFIARNRQQPFFCYLAFNAVHAPIEAPDETAQKYQAARAVEARYQGGGDKDRGPIAAFAAMIEHLDRGVGTVLDTLKREGLADNTLVFFLSDNGGAFDPQQFNRPLRGKKHQDYEGGIRTPYFVSWPRRFNGGRTIDAPVMGMDILPTILDAAGQPPFAHLPLDGRSLLPLIEGKVTQVHEQLCWASSVNGWWAIREGGWKLVSFRDHLELYDLEKDPGEAADVATHQPERVAALRASHQAWLAGMADPMTPGHPKVWKPGVVGEDDTEERKGKKERKRKRQDPPLP